MTVTAYEVMEYIRHYARLGSDRVFVRNADLKLLSSKQVHELLTEIGSCKVIPSDDNEPVEDSVERLGIKRKEFTGSLPIDNPGKWLKTK